MRDDLPTGTVTFLFTDVEGSTKLLHSLGAEGYADALAEHRRVIREACAAEGGVEVDTQGDAFFFAFPTAPGALAAASALHRCARLRPDRRCGSACTRERRFSPRRATSAATSIVPPASPLPATAGRCSSRPRRRSSSSSSCETSASTGSRTSPRPSASTSSEMATSRRSRRLYRTNLPVPATPFLGARAELAEVVELLTGEDDAPAHPHRPRRHRQDPACPAGRGRSLRVLPRRHLLGAARAASRSRARPPLARAARSRSRKSRARRSTTRSPHLSGKSLLCLLDNVEHLLPEAAERIAALRASERLAPARHEPRAASHRRRADLAGAAARRERRRARSSSLAHGPSIRRSPRARRWRSSAPVSTSFPSRSSSPPPARPSSRPSSYSSDCRSVSTS